MKGIYSSSKTYSNENAPQMRMFKNAAKGEILKTEINRSLIDSKTNENGEIPLELSKTFFFFWSLKPQPVKDSTKTEKPIELKKLKRFFILKKHISKLIFWTVMTFADNIVILKVAKSNTYSASSYMELTAIKFL